MKISWVDLLLLMFAAALAGFCFALAIVDEGWYVP